MTGISGGKEDPARPDTMISEPLAYTDTLPTPDKETLSRRDNPVTTIDLTTWLVLIAAASSWLPPPAFWWLCWAEVKSPIIGVVSVLLVNVCVLVVPTTDAPPVIPWTSMAGPVCPVNWAVVGAPTWAAVTLWGLELNPVWPVILDQSLIVTCPAETLNSLPEKEATPGVEVVAGRPDIIKLVELVYPVTPYAPTNIRSAVRLESDWYVITAISGGKADPSAPETPIVVPSILRLIIPKPVRVTLSLRVEPPITRDLTTWSPLIASARSWLPWVALSC